MLKPTERPPPSCAPRFAASITPGPPPVITAQPASANRRATDRASRYGAESSPTRAEPNIVTAGRSIRATASKPCRNSSAIRLTSARTSPSLARIRLSSKRGGSEAARDMRLVHAEHEQRGEAEVGDRHRGPLPRPHAVVRPGGGKVPHLPAPVELHPGEDEDEDEDRVRPQDDEADEADGEPHPAEPEVEPERDEDREEELRLEQDGAVLREERARSCDRCPDPPQDVTPGALGTDRAVLVVRRRLVGGQLVVLRQPVARFHRRHGSGIGRPSAST